MLSRSFFLSESLFPHLDHEDPGPLSHRAVARVKCPDIWELASAMPGTQYFFKDVYGTLSLSCFIVFKACSFQTSHLCFCGINSLAWAT